MVHGGGHFAQDHLMCNIARSGGSFVSGEILLSWKPRQLLKTSIQLKTAANWPGAVTVKADGGSRVSVLRLPRAGGWLVLSPYGSSELWTRSKVSVLRCQLSSLVANKLMCKLASWSLKVASSSPFQLKEVTLFQSLVASRYFIELWMFSFGKPVLLGVSMVKGKVFLKLPTAGQVLL